VGAQGTGRWAGPMELVENRRTWLCSSLEARGGYWASVRFSPMDKEAQDDPQKDGDRVAWSERAPLDFSTDRGPRSDAWIPGSESSGSGVPFPVAASPLKELASAA